MELFSHGYLVIPMFKSLVLRTLRSELSFLFYGISTTADCAKDSNGTYPFQFTGHYKANTSSLDQLSGWCLVTSRK